MAPDLFLSLSKGERVLEHKKQKTCDLAFLFKGLDLLSPVFTLKVNMPLVQLFRESIGMKLSQKLLLSFVVLCGFNSPFLCAAIEDESVIEELECGSFEPMCMNDEESYASVTKSPLDRMYMIFPGRILMMRWSSNEERDSVAKFAANALLDIAITSYSDLLKNVFQGDVCLEDVKPKFAKFISELLLFADFKNFQRDLQDADQEGVFSERILADSSFVDVTSDVETARKGLNTCISELAVHQFTAGQTALVESLILKFAAKAKELAPAAFSDDAEKALVAFADLQQFAVALFYELTDEDKTTVMQLFKVFAEKASVLNESIAYVSGGITHELLFDSPLLNVVFCSSNISFHADSLDRQVSREMIYSIADNVVFTDLEVVRDSKYDFSNGLKGFVERSEKGAAVRIFLADDVQVKPLAQAPGLSEVTTYETVLDAQGFMILNEEKVS